MRDGLSCRVGVTKGGVEDDSTGFGGAAPGPRETLTGDGALLDDVRIESSGGRLVEDLALVNHGEWVQASGPECAAASGVREPGMAASDREPRSRW